MTCKSNPTKQRNLIFLLPKLLTTEDQEGQSDQISVLCKYIRQIIITRPRNVKEANNLFVFDRRGLLGILMDSCSMKLDEHTCKRLSVLSLGESCFCYCCIGVLLPFDTFEVISGAVIYYNHTVPGQSPRLSAHSFASTWS